jgi:hypothetical protein
MDNKQIINGKYFPVLVYLNEHKGKFFPYLKQKDIAVGCDCSVRSVRDYLTCKKVSWDFLFRYSELLLCELSITCESIVKKRNYG